MTGLAGAVAIRRGTGHSDQDLVAVIGAFMDGCNDRCQPSARTKEAGKLLATIKP